MTSLRQRLGRVMLVLLAGLVLQWLLADRMMVRVGENEMATRLQHDSDSLVAALAIDDGGRLAVDDRVAGVIYRQPYSGHYFLVGMEGQRHASDSFGAEHAFEPPAGPGLGHITGPQGQPLLYLAREAAVQGRRVQVVVAEDQTDMRRELLEFRAAFLAASVALLAAALWLQRREIGQALRPVEALRDAILRLPEGGKPPRLADVPAEIRPLLEEIVRLMAIVEARLQRSRTAVGNLSHAVKTPLTGLIRLLDDARIAAHPELQQALRAQANAIGTRIERELKRARLAGEQRGGSRFDPVEELPALVELLQRIHADKRLAIEWHAPEGVLPFEREDVLELIGNLADNACKWATGRVSIEVRGGERPEIVVSDDGPGCPPEAMETLATRGVRADESRPGYGLGLSIVRDIVEHAGGRLQFHPSPMGGLEVVASLGR